MTPPLFLDTPSPRRACASDDLPAKPSEVPATLTRYEATQRHWHTVVIGAGPTGSSVAMRLARAGLRVLLIDRDTLPRGKVCGCCISPQGVSELRLLGFSSIEESLHATPLHSLVLSAAGKQVHLPLLGGAALSRERLDAALATAATRAGADFLPKTTLTQIDQSNVGVRCTLRDQESTATLSAMSVVIAAGLAPAIRINGSRQIRSVPVSSRVGLGATFYDDTFDLEPGQLLMAVARHGYVGIVRLEDDRLDIAAAVDRSVLAGSATTNHILSEMLYEAGHRVPNELAHVVLSGTAALTHRSPLADGLVFRAGDSAAYAEPFTGEGIGWALQSGRFLSQAIVQGVDHSSTTSDIRLNAATIAAHWQSSHNRALRGRLFQCRVLSIALRQPSLVGMFIRFMNAWPAFGKQCVRLAVANDCETFTT